MTKETRKIKKVRLNEAEENDISEKMRLENCTNFSEFMRNAALKRKPKISQKNVSTIELISQIKYVGNNLNQIAQALNIIKKSVDKSQFNYAFVEQSVAECVAFIEQIKKGK